MEDVYDIQLQLQNLQHELEFVKKIKNVEVARREHLELQLRKVRQELEQSKADRVILQEKLRQSQNQVWQFEAQLLHYKQKNVKAEHEERDTDHQMEENPENDDDDDSDIEVLEVLPTPRFAIHGTPIQSPSTSSQFKISSYNSNSSQSAANSCAPSKPIRAESVIVQRPFKFSTACSAVTPNIIQSSGSRPIVAARKSASFFPAKIPNQPRSPVAVAKPKSKFRIVDMDTVSLNDSERSSHGKLTKNPNTCPYCGLEPATPNLKSHIAKVHRSPVSPWWSCSLCKKQYSCGQTLKHHYIADHCNIRYACGICDALFKSIPNAKVHRQTHHDSKEILQKQKSMKKTSN